MKSAKGLDGHYAPSLARIFLSSLQYIDTDLQHVIKWRICWKKHSLGWCNKEARGINDANFGEVHLIMGYTVITEKGIVNKDRFYLSKAL